MGAQSKRMLYIDTNPKVIFIEINSKEQKRNKLNEIAKNLTIPVYQIHLDMISKMYCLEEVFEKKE